jgi:hypothetical protein
VRFREANLALEWEAWDADWHGRFINIVKRPTINPAIRGDTGAIARLLSAQYHELMWLSARDLCPWSDSHVSSRLQKVFNQGRNLVKQYEKDEIEKRVKAIAAADEIIDFLSRYTTDHQTDETPNIVIHVNQMFKNGMQKEIEDIKKGTKQLCRELRSDPQGRGRVNKFLADCAHRLIEQFGKADSSGNGISWSEIAHLAYAAVVASFQREAVISGKNYEETAAERKLLDTITGDHVKTWVRQFDDRSLKLFYRDNPQDDLTGHLPEPQSKLIHS